MSLKIEEKKSGVFFNWLKIYIKYRKNQGRNRKRIIQACDEMTLIFSQCSFVRYFLFVIDGKYSFVFKGVLKVLVSHWLQAKLRLFNLFLSFLMPFVL